MGRVVILLFCLSVFSLTIFAQSSAGEICDNGLDDDGDGLIDLNDGDCICKGIKDSVFVPSSLVPNPSFELYKQCPDGLAQLDRSLNWIQASPATSDYFNLCGFKDDPFRGTPPQPLPAGRGYVGFLDIQNYPQRGIYKEYIGACLTSTMMAGKEYTLTYWVGFGRRGQVFGPRATLNMAIFGTSDCKYLPFAVNPPGYQCPTKYQGWFEMSRVTVSGSNQWKKVTVKLRPTVNVAAICLGPACATTDGDYYYWLDELILEETVKFDSLKVEISGNPCTDTVILKSSKSSLAIVQYQWYKDGVAIAGATSQNYPIPKGALGKYQLRVSYKNDCELSKSFQYNIDQFVTRLNPQICAGDSVVINSKTYRTTGVYYDTLKNFMGCDSILEISVSMHPRYADTLNAEICQGDSYVFDGNICDSTSLYQFDYFSMNGCDSIRYLNLIVHPKSVTNITQSICEGKSTMIGGKAYSKAGIYSDSLVSIYGCDSIVNIQITENQKSFVAISSQICEGDRYLFGSRVLTVTGIYSDTSASIFGCDSITTLFLSVKSKSYFVVDTSLCTGQVLKLGNNTYTSPGAYQIRTVNADGCDSLVTVNLQYHPVFNRQIDTSICDGDFILFNGIRITSEGQYTQNLLSADRCDSITTLNVRILQTGQFVLDTILCHGSTLSIGGNVLDASGQYIMNKINAAGCDSTVIINLVIQIALNIASIITPVRCHGERNGSVDLTVNGGQAPYQYRWSSTDNMSRIQNLLPGIYIVTVTDKTGCSAISSIELDDPSCFCFEVNAVDGSCSGPNPIAVDVKQLSGRPVREMWIGGNQVAPLNFHFSGLQPGKYPVILRDSIGCTWMDSFDVKFNIDYVNDLGEDTIRAVVGDSIPLKLPASVTLQHLTGFWKNQSATLCTTCEAWKVVASPEINTYRFEGIDEYGCPIVYQIVITAMQEFYVPNVFSPNGDGVNDWFNLFSDSSIGKIDRLQIFSRWGEIVFESNGGIPNSQYGAWDGNFRGQPVGPGVFVYLIQFSDKAGRKHQLRGDVTVVR
ncbi:MAG: gliding motility-associated C-terminal domain-containing protein [Saprospiraceae bacterium]